MGMRNKALKLGQVVGAERPMLTMLFLAILLGIPLSVWAYLDMYHRLGAATSRVEIWALGFGWESYTWLEGWLQNPTASRPGAMAETFVGFIVAFTLDTLRKRFLWFTVHPLGYAMAPSWGMSNLWSCMFVGSLIKAGVLRYGGLTAYRSAVPLFLGLMLGEFAIGSFWSLYGVLRQTRTYEFWP